MPHEAMAPRIRLGGQRCDDGQQQPTVCINVGLSGALPPVLHYDVCVGFWEVIWMSVLMRAL